MLILSLFFLCILISPLHLSGQSKKSVVKSYDSIATQIIRTALGSGKSYELLKELATGVGHRYTGSPAAAQAVKWAKLTMEKLGFDSVWLEPVMVPRWIRKPAQEAYILESKMRPRIPLSVIALGGSIGTDESGVTAAVIEVESFQDLRQMGKIPQRKIVFFNRPMDPSLFSTFDAYRQTVDQRTMGAIEAAKAGGVAVLVRSLTTRIDDHPHTGVMNYLDTIPKLPAAAISTKDAEMLSKLLREEREVKVHLKLSAETLPPVESANVIGELRGTEKPNEVIVVSGHLDSWDVGQGAHDDGAGCVHAIEALRLLKELGLRPRRTIRAVLFMDEEAGLSGAKAYAERDLAAEKHIAAIESDAGGFSPRGFAVGDSVAYNRIFTWMPLFRSIWADRIIVGSSEADIAPLARKGVPPIGLIVDNQRYFDYHHSDNDVIENVNERELALGTACLAIMAYVLAQEGL